MAEIRPLWLASLVLVAVLLPGVTSAWASSAVEPAIPLEEASLQAAGPGGALLDGPLVPSALVAVPAGSDFDTAVVDAAPGPLLERSQVVTLYGYPGVPAMGDLGGYTPDEAAAEVRRLAWVYDALNGERGAVGALHVVVSVAHPAPLADGSYLSHLDPAVIAEYVEAARRNGVLLVLDTQLGMVDPVEEARRLEPFLVEPFVHLALDPEFAMRAKGRTGSGDRERGRGRGERGAGVPRGGGAGARAALEAARGAPVPGGHADAFGGVGGCARGAAGDQRRWVGRPCRSKLETYEAFA
ncbi:MAG: hypothetical protein R3B59_09100 [Dehalococcoidia bacterium]